MYNNDNVADIVNFRDVESLKSITEYPEDLPENIIDYYKDYVEVEYFSAKQNQFVAEKKYFYIPLFDPAPIKTLSQPIYEHFTSLKRPIDPLQVMNTFPQHMTTLLYDLAGQMNLYEKISFYFREAVEGDIANTLKALYLSEALLKTEPHLIAIHLLGHYVWYNINWCIRVLNKNEAFFYLEDNTVSFLFDVYHKEMNNKNQEIKIRDKVLAYLFRIKAFPSSSAEALS